MSSCAIFLALPLLKHNNKNGFLCIISLLGNCEFVAWSEDYENPVYDTP